MMIADLVDGDDFRQHLVGLGIDIPADASPDTCVQLTRAAMPVVGLRELITALRSDSVTLLPEVRQALDALADVA